MHGDPNNWYQSQVKHESEGEVIQDEIKNLLKQNLTIGQCLFSLLVPGFQNLVRLLHELGGKERSPRRLDFEGRN